VKKTLFDCTKLEQKNEKQPSTTKKTEVVELLICECRAHTENFIIFSSGGRSYSKMKGNRTLFFVGCPRMKKAKQNKVFAMSGRH